MMSQPATHASLRIFGSPLRYLQGPGALALVGKEAKLLGKRPLLVADEFVLKLVEPTLQGCLKVEGLALNALSFTGEVTAREVERLLKLALLFSADMVIAAGGGKGIDIGKALASKLGCPVITVPTAASNDAPTSKIYVLYDEHHRLASVEHLTHNPASVVVDTTLIARAPSQLLRAGIGDALSKKFEVEMCADAKGLNIYGGLATHTAVGLAAFTYQQLRTHAEPALAAVSQGHCDHHVEALVEATVLLSGLCFENGGLSIAHAMTRGLSSVPGPREALHGLQVAYGLLVQWVLEGRPGSELDELMQFYQRIGLPRSLRELGLKQEVTLAVLDAVSGPTLAAPHTRNFPRALTADNFKSAMLMLEQRQAG